VSALALLRFTALRQILFAPLRSLLTLIAIALGVGMLIGMSASNGAVLSAFDEVAQRAGGRADLEVSSDESGVEHEVTEELTAHPELIAHAASRLEQFSYLSSGTSSERVLVLGLDFLGDSEFMPYRVSQGLDVLRDPIPFLNDPGAILITEQLARRRGLKVGSELRLRTAEGDRPFHVAGLLEETTDTKVFAGQVVVMFLDAAQIAFGRGHRVDRIDVQLTQRANLKAGLAATQRLVGVRGQVAPPSQRSQQLARLTASLKAGVEVQALSAIMIAMFLVYNAVGISVGQRKREIGILRSLGADRSTILFVFMAEAAVLGLLGSIVGIGLGWLIASGVTQLLAPTISRIYETIGVPAVNVSWSLALTGVTVGFFATLAAAWVPAQRAARFEPVEAMQANVHTSSRAALPPRQLAWLGLVLFVGGLLVSRSQTPYLMFLGVGVLPLAGALCTPAAVASLTRAMRWLARPLVGTPVMLGVDNTGRDIGRSGLTAAALAITTAMSLMLAVYTASFEQSIVAWIDHMIVADAMITAGSPVHDQNALPFAPEWVERVAAMPGVQAASGVRNLSVTAHDLRLVINAIDMRLYLSRVHDGAFRRVLSGPNPIPADALLREPAVLISENFARRTGLGPGDTVELPSPTGMHRFAIVAVIVDYSSDQGLIMMDLSTLREFWRDTRIEAVAVFAQPGVDVPQLVSEIRARARSQDAGLFVLEGREVKAELLQLFRQALQLSKASELVALVVALLGIIGTMAAAVLDRTREIGSLRALGASRPQIVWSVMAESGWLALCALCVAAAIAAPLSLLFLEVVGPRTTGWNVPIFFPPLDVLRVALTVVATGLLAGALPGLRAAYVAVPSALLHE